MFIFLTLGKYVVLTTYLKAISEGCAEEDQVIFSSGLILRRVFEILRKNLG
jgi:hypothetical protein